MRVLAYVHTFNDGEFIDQVLDAIRRQTRPTDAIIIVDNASTDGIRDRTFPDGVTVVRNSTNLGTSGAVRIGFANALEQGFDWTWILDPDSVPEFDALENLLGFFERLPPSEQEPGLPPRHGQRRERTPTNDTHGVDQVHARRR
jgi:GT2 family glycosyltransferase